ncbi:FkbM family methyltransferase [Psychroserpens sp.]
MIHKIKILIEIFKHRKNPCKYLLGHFLVKTGLNKNITFKRKNGYKLKLSNSSLSLTYYADEGDYDEDNFISKILKPGDTYVDVGANIGSLVLTASISVSNSGKVVGIEAHPETFKNLEANIKLNKSKNIKLVQSAVGDRKGVLFFSNINSDDQNKVLLEPKNGIEVEVNTLDELLLEYQNVSVLKIDVEGYEKYVLEGAKETLNKTDVILFESWENHFSNFGYNTGNVIQILNNQGFEVYKKDQKMLKLLNVDYRSEECENLLALKDVKIFINELDLNIFQ